MGKWQTEMCETWLKRSVEVFNGRNLDHLPHTTDLSDIMHGGKV